MWVIENHYLQPPKVQEHLLTTQDQGNNKNLFLVSQSGTGKTRGIIIAALNKIDINLSETQCLIFCSTFDAACQTFLYCSEFIKETELSVKLGLVSKNQHEHALHGENVHEHILIGTPNELFEAAKSNGCVDTVSDIYLDDADAYAAYQKMSAFFGQLKKSTRLVFLMRNTNMNTIGQMKKWGSRNTKFVFLEKEETFNQNIQQYFITMASSEDRTWSKHVILEYICNEIAKVRSFGQIIVFCKVINSVIKLEPLKKILLYRATICYIAK